MTQRLITEAEWQEMMKVPITYGGRTWDNWGTVINERFPQGAQYVEDWARAEIAYLPLTEYVDWRFVRDTVTQCCGETLPEYKAIGADKWRVRYPERPAQLTEITLHLSGARRSQRQ